MCLKNNVFTNSGNVFADLGLANSQERLIKARLPCKISEIIASQNLTQIQTAGILGIDQPKIFALTRSNIMCG